MKRLSAQQQDRLRWPERSKPQGHASIHQVSHSNGHRLGEPAWAATPKWSETASDTKIEFRNGATVEDTYAGREGIKVTSPGGRVTKFQGEVEEDSVVFFLPAANGKLEPWRQTFPAGGGSQLEQLTDIGNSDYSVLSISIDSGGRATASRFSHAEGEQELSARLRGSRVLLDTPEGQEVVVPPVPLKWFVTAKR